MKNLNLWIALILFVQTGVVSFAGQAETKTYAQTRKLLLEMESGLKNEPLKKLFEQADRRMPDLIQNLYDSDKKVSINSQMVLLYLADEKSLTEVKKWREYCRKHNKECWSPKMELLTETDYFYGNDSDLAKLALKNLSLLEAGKLGAKGLSAKVIAYNKERKTALIELIEGEIFTTGWHIVIRQEGSQWRLVSDNLMWNS